MELNLFQILLLERQRYCTEICWSICPLGSKIFFLILLIVFLLIIVIFLEYSLVVLLLLFCLVEVTGQFLFCGYVLLNFVGRERSLR